MRFRRFPSGFFRSPRVTRLGLAALLACVWAIAAHSDTGALKTSLETVWFTPRGDVGATGAVEVNLPKELKLQWESETPEAIETSVTCDGQRVFYTDVMGGVGAVELESGKEVWRRDFDTGFVAAAAVYLPELVSSAAIPVLSSQGETDNSTNGETLASLLKEESVAKPRIVVGDVEGNIYSLDPATGETHWTAVTDGEINAAVTYVAWLSDEPEPTLQLRVLQTSQDGSLYCFAATDGELIWKYESGDQIRCGASVANGRTYLGGCDGGLHIIDIARGEAVREPLPLGGPTGSTPVLSENGIFVPIMDGVLFAFDAKSGEVRWEYEDPDFAQDYRGDVAVSGDRLVIASRTKNVDAIDLDSGKRIWQVTLRRRSDASPLITGNDVWIAGSDGRLLRLSLDDGEQRWEFETRGAFFAAPSVVGQRLLIADDEGVIRCFGPPG